MSTQGRRLGLSLVQEHFGDVIGRVAGALIMHRRRTLRSVVAATSLSLQQTKHSLLVLMQHSLVHVEMEGTTTFYILDVAAVLFRARAPAMLALVEHTLGAEAAQVLQLIILNGRITGEDAVGRFQSAGATGTDDDIVQPLEAAVVAATMRRLADEHLIMHLREDPNAAIDADRFTVSCLDDLATTEHAAAASGDKRKRAEPPKASSKRSRVEVPGAMAAAAVAVSTGGPKAIYWQINMRQFRRRFRNQWLVDFAGKKLDASAAQLLEAGLASGVTSIEAQEVYVRPFNTQYLHSKVPSMSLSEIRGIMDWVCEDLCGVVFRIGSDAGGSYKVNVAVAAGLARDRTIAQLVDGKFGTACGRVFRLLLAKKHLETNQVQELAMIGNFKATKTKLNQLFQNRVIKLQEIPKRADRLPSHCVFLWSLDINAVNAQMLENCYQSQANIRARLKIEADKHARLLRQQIPKLEEGEEEDDLIKDHLAEVSKVNRALDRLQMAELEMDKTVSALRDFTETVPARRFVMSFS